MNDAKVHKHVPRSTHGPLQCWVSLRWSADGWLILALTSAVRHGSEQQLWKLLFMPNFEINITSSLGCSDYHEQDEGGCYRLLHYECERPRAPIT